MSRIHSTVLVRVYRDQRNGLLKALKQRSLRLSHLDSVQVAALTTGLMYIFLILVAIARKTGGRKWPRSPASPWFGKEDKASKLLSSSIVIISFTNTWFTHMPQFGHWLVILFMSSPLLTFYLTTWLPHLSVWCLCFKRWTNVLPHLASYSNTHKSWRCHCPSRPLVCTPLVQGSNCLWWKYRPQLPMWQWRPVWTPRSCEHHLFSRLFFYSTNLYNMNFPQESRANWSQA